VLYSLFIWVYGSAENPLGFCEIEPAVLPQWNSGRGGRKGRRGLPAVRLLRWGGRGRRGGPEGHGDVWFAVGNGRSRPVHVCRRRCSSAARNSACSRRDSPSEPVSELHQRSRRIGCKELENGSPDCSVYTRWRVAEVRREWIRLSDEAMPQLKLGEASQPLGEAV
jgi:hypothetical protein